MHDVRFFRHIILDKLIEKLKNILFIHFIHSLVRKSWSFFICALF